MSPHFARAPRRGPFPRAALPGSFSAHLRFCLVPLLAIGALLGAGCAHYPVNARLERIDPQAGYRPRNLASPENSSSLLMFLAFSGGGTRAAALAYGVLEELARTNVTWEGSRRRLLDEVDYISAVSGGSFTAAYYGLHGDAVFEELRPRFLDRNVQRDLEWRLLWPRNWVRLGSPSFSRSDMVAEYYDEHLFGGATYADLLARKHAPFVSLNATDVSLGATFSFTQDHFDLLCSDLSALPLSRAVAASSAFPVVLSAITLRNYAGSCRGLPGPVSSESLHSRGMMRAWELQAYSDGRRHPYLHLLDGGLADNLGLRGPLESVFARGGLRQALERNLDPDLVRKILIFVVDASARKDRGIDRRPRPPGLVRTTMALGEVPIERYTYETLELLRELVHRFETEWNAAAAREATVGPEGSVEPPTVRFYLVEVSLDDLPGEERETLGALPTSFRLPPGAVDRLRQAATRLMRQSPDYRDLLRELDGSTDE